MPLAVGAAKMAGMRTCRIALAGLLAVAASASMAAAGQSPPPLHPAADVQALELARQAIAFRSVKGPGNETNKVAELFRSALVGGGFANADISITPVDDTAYLVARWRGSDP